MGRLGHVSATIEADRLAGDVAVRHQLQHKRRGFVGGSESADGDQIRPSIRIAMHHLCVNQCRRDRVGRYAVAGQEACVTMREMPPSSAAIDDTMMITRDERS